MNQISAVIITLNEERNISRCLQSLKGVADEIIILDSGSTDRTLEICHAEEVTVVNIQWKGYSAAKNQGNSLAASSYILSMDADESLSPILKESILSGKPHLSGAYQFNRLTHYCGKWIRHCGWYPDKKIRLFPKGKARWEGDYVHETLTLDPEVSVTHLVGDLHHYSIYTKEDHLNRIHTYAKLGAEKMKARGRKYSRLKHLFSPIARFIRMYIFQAGFLDGKAGLQVCWISAKAVAMRYNFLRQ